jgi:hypothetical protein
VASDQRDAERRNDDGQHRRNHLDVFSGAEAIEQPDAARQAGTPIKASSRNA